MKQFSRNWHLVRVLQLFMGLLLTGSYLFYTPDGITLAFGLLLLFQAAFNISCVSGACAAPREGTSYEQHKPGEEADEVYVEEISQY